MFGNVASESQQALSPSLSGFVKNVAIPVTSKCRRSFALQWKAGKKKSKEQPSRNIPLAAYVCEAHVLHQNHLQIYSRSSRSRRGP